MLSCAPIDLLNYLKENVTALRDDSSNQATLKLFVLDDEYEMPANAADELSVTDYNPKRFKGEFMARKRLILIYQGPQIVLGVTVFEYARVDKQCCEVLDWTRSYIQYVDTTGLFCPRQTQSHLTRSLVKSYIRYCSEILNMGSLHFLATAKPAFLFAGSEFIAGKRPLSPIKLINWWISVLSELKFRVFAYSPFEEAEGSTRLRKRIATITGWTYGFPYAQSSPCVDHIPLFEDDPKWRHFEATILDDAENYDEKQKEGKKKKKKRVRMVVEEEEDYSTLGCKMSVKEFFESMQLRPEFRSEPSVFFTVKFEKCVRDSLASDPAAASQHKKSDLATFGLKMLGGLTFESEAAARTASQKISGWLKLMAVPGVDIDESEQKDGDKENTLERKSGKRSEEVVNSLQGFIKKKAEAK